jgi:hypothetical protein
MQSIERATRKEDSTKRNKLLGIWMSSMVASWDISHSQWNPFGLHPIKRKG